MVAAKPRPVERLFEDSGYSTIVMVFWVEAVP
jgi:hypothetical protein